MYSMHKSLDVEKNGYVARDQLYMRYSEGLDMQGVSDVASAWRHEMTMTKGGSRIVYITEKPVRQHA